MKKAKEDWIVAQCEEIETCLNKNNSSRAYQLKKDLTSEKQVDLQLSRTGLGNVLLKNKRFSADRQNTTQESCGDNAVLDFSQPQEEDLKPILRRKIEISSSVTNKGEVCWS